MFCLLHAINSTFLVSHVSESQPVSIKFLTNYEYYKTCESNFEFPRNFSLGNFMFEYSPESLPIPHDKRAGPDPYYSANSILMPMPEDIEIFKVVPIDEYSIFLPGAAARFLPRNRELLLRHRFSFRFLAHIYSLL